MRDRIKSTVAGLGAIVLALSLQACAEPEKDPSDETEKAQQKLTKCYDYENTHGDSCSICFEYVVTRTKWGNFLEPVSHTDFCD